MKKQELMKIFEDNYELMNKVQNYIKKNFETDKAFCSYLLNRIREWDVEENFNDFEIYKNYIKQYEVCDSFYNYLNKYVGVKLKDDSQVYFGVLVDKTAIQNNKITNFQLVSKFKVFAFNINDVDCLLFTNGQIIKINENEKE